MDSQQKGIKIMSKFLFKMKHLFSDGIKTEAQYFGSNHNGYDILPNIHNKFQLNQSTYFLNEPILRTLNQ